MDKLTDEMKLAILNHKGIKTEEQLNVNLLPCPWCGNIVSISVESHIHISCISFGCLNPSLTVEISWMSFKDESYRFMPELHYQEALQKWNTRFSGINDRDDEAIFSGDLIRRHNYLYRVLLIEFETSFILRVVARKNDTDKTIWDPIIDGIKRPLIFDNINKKEGTIYDLEFAHLNLINYDKK